MRAKAGGNDSEACTCPKDSKFQDILFVKPLTLLLNGKQELILKIQVLKLSVKKFLSKLNGL